MRFSLHLDKEKSLIGLITRRKKKPILMIWKMLQTNNKKRVRSRPAMFDLEHGATLFLWRAEKRSTKLGGHKNVSRKAWRAKFNLLKTNYTANLKF